MIKTNLILLGLIAVVLCGLDGVNNFTNIGANYSSSHFLN